MGNGMWEIVRAYGCLGGCGMYQHEGDGADVDDVDTVVVHFDCFASIFSGPTSK